MRLHELIEALNKQQYRNLMREVGKIDASMYKDIFLKYPHDNGAWRIYLPADSITIPEKKSQTQHKVEDTLRKNGYQLDSYRENRALDQKKQPRKIGKLLQDLDPELLKQYVKDNESKYLSGKRDLMVCISRHPKDIGGMSTGQKWESCMHVDDGANKRFVPAAIQHGVIVAYLIEKSDVKLEKPYARVLILPFVSDDGKEFVFGVSNRSYPDESNHYGFKEIVANWAEEVNNSKTLKNYRFKVKPEIYSEVESETLDRDIKHPSLEYLYDLMWQGGGSINLEGRYIESLPDNLEVKKDLNISNTKIKKLPTNLKVGGSLYAAGSSLEFIPDDIMCNKIIDVSYTPIASLPNNLSLDGLNLEMCRNIKELPLGLEILGFLNLTASSITSLPTDIYIEGSLDISNTYIKELPDNLELYDLKMYNTTAKHPPFEKLPNNLYIYDNLILYNLPHFTSLPDDLKVDGNVILSLTGVPKDFPKPIGIKGELSIR